MEVMEELNFIVLKVNGVDVSNHAYNEMVQMFLVTQEPFLIEVQRKLNESHRNTKTDDEIIKTMANLKVSPKQRGALATLSTLDNVEPANICPLSNSLAFKLRDKTLSTSQRPSKINKETQTNPMYFNALSLSGCESNERIIEEEHNLLEQCLAPEIAIEEITLRKSLSNERLGLTVCYSCYGTDTKNSKSTNTGNISNAVLLISEEIDNCAEVYISHIQADSIAGRDGRLRPGDQILQINGKDIKNKEETENLIAENTNAVTLLVSRYLYADEDFNDHSVHLDIDDDESENEDEEFYDENHLGYANFLISDERGNEVFELNRFILAKSEKQSGKKRELDFLNDKRKDCAVTKSKVVDTSTSADGKIIANPETTIVVASNRLKSTLPSLCTTNLPKKKVSIHRAINFNDAIRNTNDYEAEHIYETIPEDIDSEPVYCSPYQSSTSTLGDVLNAHNKQSVPNWLGINAHAMGSRDSNMVVSKQMTSSEVEPKMKKCDIKSCHKSTSVRFIKTNVNELNNRIEGVDCINCTKEVNGMFCQVDDQDNSSSVYNTSGSNQSTAQTSILVNQDMNSNSSLLEKDPIGCAPIESQKKASQKLSLNDNVNFLNMSFIRLRKDTSAETTTEYKNSEPLISLETSKRYKRYNLLHELSANNKNLKKQQEVDREPLGHQPQMSSFIAPNLTQYNFIGSQETQSGHLQPISIKGTNACDTVTSNILVTRRFQNDDSMVWKVKRRQDGTRYIVRRPARTHLLRDHTGSQKFRNDVTTTEDDTISEVKLGRYWSKEERKKHMERSRERRQQNSKNCTTPAKCHRVNQRDRTYLQVLPKPIRSNGHNNERTAFNTSQRECYQTNVLQQHQLHFRSSKASQELDNNVSSLLTAVCNNVFPDNCVHATSPIDNMRFSSIQQKTQTTSKSNISTNTLTTDTNGLLNSNIISFSST